MGVKEMLTIKSDAVRGRSAAYDAIVRGDPFKTPNVPASFHVLLNELRGLALDIDLVGLKTEPGFSEDQRRNTDFSSVQAKEF